MDKYVKQIQTRMNRRLKGRGLSVTKDQVRQVYTTICKDVDCPTDVEMSRTIELLAQQFSVQEETIVDVPSVGQLVIGGEVEIEKPETIEITPESNPDIWEILQPPATEQAPQEETNNSIVPAENNLPTQQQPQASASGLIPQGEVAGMVSQAFANQPQGFKDQVTEYAMTHTFENVRQVQEFLEQLRGMEFNLLVNTLQDHFARRGSMLTVLNDVLTGQKAKDDEASQAFFANFNSRLAVFQKEMEARLSKQGL
jgi:hypothetical protein